MIHLLYRFDTGKSIKILLNKLRKNRKSFPGKGFQKRHFIYPTFPLFFFRQNRIFRKKKNMIARIWHGYTTFDNADIYEDLLLTEIFPEIRSKNIKGYKGEQLLRRELENEVEFTTMIWFENIEAVKDFVGEDYETVYVPDKARAVLSRFDQRTVHAELRHSRL